MKQQKEEIRENIQKKIDSIRELPTLPEIVFKSSKLLSDPDTSIKIIVKELEKDQSICSKLLRLVNSAFYGFPGEVESVHQAVVILGFNTVRNAIISISLINTFPMIGQIQEEFDIRVLWEHSIGCGLISQYLSKEFGIDPKDESYIAGILHDIGKVVLAAYFPVYFSYLIETTGGDISLFYDKENEILGINHTEIGYKVSKKWNFPQLFSDVIFYHHVPSENNTNNILVELVHVADLIYYELKKNDSDRLNLNTNVLSKISISEEDLNKIIPALRDSLSSINEFLNITLG